ncbi:ester cyclase [Kitasatospora sp. NPDC059571]|uniref:ester cyclase n=1 Tax=Kitasatospora sp. NPDC059571 TaxID=3346871 RepID=UPI0036A2D17F
MTFVQIIEGRTDRVDDLNRLMDSWVEQTAGRRTAGHAVVGADRADPRHFVEIVEFPSYEEAMRNSNLPETDRIFHEMVALCDEPPTFTDLDVVRDEQLNKRTVMRLFEEMSDGSLDVLDELVAVDYRDHDIANDPDISGREGVRQAIRGWRTGFDFAFTVESQVADGDEVATRWSWTGMHRGEFMGLPATDKKVEMTGMTVFRFKDGMVQEGWWQWDRMSMMRQLGLLRM